MLIKISAKMVQCDSNNFKVLHACILFLSVIKSTVASKFNDEPVHVSLTLEVVKGGVANIPCNISLHPLRDKVQTVIWNKGNIVRSPTPIYTFDVRNTTLEQGEHWSDNMLLGGRGSFSYKDEPPKLILKDLKESDAGIYQCRVDYKINPTKHFKVNLTVIVPPEKLLIIDESGTYIDRYIIGPYNEGDTVNITCIAFGGRPLPNVTWWKENALLDGFSEIVTKKRVRNTFYMQPLQRKDLHAVFTCQASNNNMGLPVSTSITVDMNLRPLWAKLWGKQRVLSAGTSYELSCEVVGSRPLPIITWWLGGKQLLNTEESTSGGNNSTINLLNFTPSVNDNKKRLTCKATHPLIADCTVEDGWTLEVHHIPSVHIEFDSSVDNENITEGMDVILQCEIKANPWIFTVGWLYNDEPIYSNQLQDTIVSNQSLILKNVDRTKAGNFTCFGSNLEGTGESDPLQLDVKFPPTCRAGQAKIHRIALQARAEVRCQLEANPPDVQFTWRFKYNDGNTVDLPEHFITSEGLESTVHYTPSSIDDYPTLICIGQNSQGKIENPCTFHLQPPDTPEAPSNCKVTKQTESSLQVECIDEFNRGIRGEFIMEVYDAQTGKLVRNVTSRDPTFTVRGLESGIGFDVDLYVANKEGKSLVTRLPTFTLNYERSSNGTSISIDTLLLILGGVVGSFILLAILIVVVIRCRSDPNANNGSEDNRFKNTRGRYMPMKCNKFVKQADSNTSFDSFDSEIIT